MTPTNADERTALSPAEVEHTTAWLCELQRDSGEIPWDLRHKSDPWDHVHAAMGLAAVGCYEQARAAYRYMANTQDDNGAWAAERVDGCVTRATHESNHAAYVATGLWHLHRADPCADFLLEMWPCLSRAIDWVVDLQLPSGAIAWASKKGKVWTAPLITGSSSIHGSLVCAIRIAERLGKSRPRWLEARRRLARVLRTNTAVFRDTDLPQEPGLHSMDWYYPVLGGAVRGSEGRQLLLDNSATETYLTEGVGCRCVKGKPWYTIAETCEFVLALDSLGLKNRARQVLSWTRWLRTDDGGYWTGSTHPEGVVFPEGERTAWTAASVLLAHDAVQDHSCTSDFFKELDGRGLDVAAAPARRERPEYERAPLTPAE